MVSIDIYIERERRGGGAVVCGYLEEREGAKFFGSQLAR